MLRKKIFGLLFGIRSQVCVLCETLPSVFSRSCISTPPVTCLSCSTATNLQYRILCSYSQQDISQQEGRALNGVCAEGGQVSDAEQVLNVVDQHLGKGDTKAAMKTLEAGAARLVERYGHGCQALLPVFGQLSLLKFLEGDYEAALDASQHCYWEALTEWGEGSVNTTLHAVRYGVMLLAVGDVEAALPLLQECRAELESVVQDLTATVNEIPCRSQSEEVEDMMDQLFDGLVALGEAKFYHSLCVIAQRNFTHDIIKQEESGLLAGLEMLQHSLNPDHNIVVAALREHGRLVKRTLDRGHYVAHIELLLQNKRLHDTLRNSTMPDVTED